MSPNSFVFGLQTSGLARFGESCPIKHGTDVARKEICNTSEEETIHVSVSLPDLFGLAIIRTLKCLLRSRVYSGLSLVNLKKQTYWMGPRENKKTKIANLRHPQKFKPAKIRVRTVYMNTSIINRQYTATLDIDNG